MKKILSLLLLFVSIVTNAQPGPITPLNVWQWGGNSISTSSVSKIGTKNAQTFSVITNNTNAITIATNQAVTFLSSITTPTLYGPTSNSILNIFSNANGNGTINIGSGTGTVISNDIINTSKSVSIGGFIAQINLGRSTYLGSLCGINDDLGNRRNTGVGYSVLNAVTTSSHCVGMGYFALSVNTGNANTAIGYLSGQNNTSGSDNSFYGWESGATNITGKQNSSYGYLSLFGNTSGSFNSNFGYHSLSSNTTGSNNIGVGYYSGKYNTTLSNRLFINSIDRSNIVGDSTNSIIYGYQHSTNTNQLLRVNANLSTLGNSSFGTINASNTHTFYTGSASGNGFLISSLGSGRTTFFANQTTINSSNMFLDVTSAYTQLNSNTDVYLSISSGTKAHINNTNYNVTIPISINTSETNAAASAILQAQSTTKGFLPPVMTTTQKNAISSPAEGLIVYDTTLHKLCVYTGAAWETINSL